MSCIEINAEEFLGDYLSLFHLGYNGKVIEV